MLIGSQQLRSGRKFWGFSVKSKISSNMPPLQNDPFLDQGLGMLVGIPLISHGKSSNNEPKMCHDLFQIAVLMISSTYTFECVRFNRVSFFYIFQNVSFLKKLTTVVNVNHASALQ